MNNWPVDIVNPYFLFIWIFVPIVLVLYLKTYLKQRSELSEKIILSFRILLIIVIGLALSDPRIMKSSDRVNLIYCLDVSESMEGIGQKEARSFIAQNIKTMAEEDTAGLIVFGKTPSIEIEMTNELPALTYHSKTDSSFTNIHDALLMAIGRLRNQGKGRIVLLSDGNQNIKDAAEMVILAKSLNIEIYPVPIVYRESGNEIMIENLQTPENALMETPFEITISVMSTSKTEADLTLLKDNNIIETRRVKLTPGKNILSSSDSINKSGLHLYKAVLNSIDDSVSENNEGLSFTRGIGKSKILYIGSQEQGQNYLVKALETQGLLIDRKNLKDLSRTIHGLTDYNSIIIDNIAAHTLTYTFMDSVEKYVRNLGGGLIMIGGENGFGAGHYNMTPIEKALPVSMDVPTDLELTGFCLILVMDKSNSMAEGIKGNSKLEGAKTAAFSAIELLNPTDKVGVIAFDTEVQWVVPVIQAGNHKEIAQKLSMLNVSGGTDLFPALKEAYISLKDIDAVKKHIIVLSDGLTKNDDFESLVHSINDSDITVSTVAVGGGSDIKLMSSIAEWGGGRSYLTDNADNIPRIFVGDTKIAAQKIIVEAPFSVNRKTPSEILNGISEELPVIRGQVITYKKPGAQTILESREGPILATWRYGLGRSAAFMSDLSNQWGKDWVQWKDFNRFVSQMIKWSQREETGLDYSVSIERIDAEMRLTVDVIDAQRSFVNNLNLNMKVLFPSKTGNTSHLDQVLPGRYEGYFDLENTGPYYLNIFDKGSSNAPQSQVFGYATPYSVEFNQRGVNHDLLNRLAAETNGRLINPAESSFNIFSTDNDIKERGRALWPYLIPIVLLLLILEILLRKLQSVRSNPM